MIYLGLEDSMTARVVSAFSSLRIQVEDSFSLVVWEKGQPK